MEFSPGYNSPQTTAISGMKEKSVLFEIGVSQRHCRGRERPGSFVGVSPFSINAFRAKNLKNLRLSRPRNLNVESLSPWYLCPLNVQCRKFQSNRCLLYPQSSKPRTLFLADKIKETNFKNEMKCKSGQSDLSMSRVNYRDVQRAARATCADATHTRNGAAWISFY